MATGVIKIVRKSHNSRGSDYERLIAVDDESLWQWLNCEDIEVPSALAGNTKARVRATGGKTLTEVKVDLLVQQLEKKELEGLHIFEVYQGSNRSLGLQNPLVVRKGF